MLTLMLVAMLCSDPVDEAELEARFSEYFKAADENKRDVVKICLDSVERAKIALNSAEPISKPQLKVALRRAEADLAGSKRMKPFSYIDPFVTGTIGVFCANIEGRKLGSANVIGVIDKTTVVVDGYGRRGVEFKAVLRVPSTKGITRESRIGMTFVSNEWSGKPETVWVVSGINGAEDPRVAALLRVKPDAEVPVFDVVEGLEARRKQYEASNAATAVEPLP